MSTGFARIRNHIKEKLGICEQSLQDFGLILWTTNILLHGFENAWSVENDKQIEKFMSIVLINKYSMWHKSMDTLVETNKLLKTQHNFCC